MVVELLSCISLSTRSLLFHLLRSLISNLQAPATTQLLHLYFHLHHLVSSCIIDSNLFQTHQDIRIYLSSDCKQNQHCNGHNLHPTSVGNMMRSIEQMPCILNSHYPSKSNCPCMCIPIEKSLLSNFSKNRMMYTVTVKSNLCNHTSFIHM